MVFTDIPRTNLNYLLTLENLISVSVKSVHLLLKKSDFYSKIFYHICISLLSLLQTFQLLAELHPIHHVLQ